MMLHPKYPVIKFKIKYTLGFEFLNRSCDRAQEGQFRTVLILFCVPFDETLRQGWGYKSFPGQVVPGMGEMRQEGKPTRGVISSRFPVWATGGQLSRGTMGSSAEHALVLSHWKSNEAGAFTHHQFLSVVCGLLLGL